MSSKEKDALLAAFTQMRKKDRTFLIGLTCRLKQQHQERAKGNTKGGA